MAFKIKPAVADFLRDCIGVAGCGVISFGVWLIYQPCGYVVGGALLVGLAFLAGRERAS